MTRRANLRASRVPIRTALTALTVPLFNVETRNLTAQDLVAQQPMEFVVESEASEPQPPTEGGAPVIPPPAEIMPYDAPVMGNEIQNLNQVDHSGIKFNLNYVRSPSDPRDAKYRIAYRDIINEEDLPKQVNLREDWGDVFDQGELGSCVANTVSGCIRAVRKKDGLAVFNPSRLYIYYYGRDVEGFDTTEDSGMYIRSGYKAVATYSVCGENNWPYNIDNFDNEPSELAKNAAKQHRQFKYLNLETPVEIKHSLSQGYPVSFGTTVYSSFMTASVARSGAVPMPDKDNDRVLGGHAMTLIGYDEEAEVYHVANSWGNEWGKGGFCTIPYKYIHNVDETGDFWTARQFN